MSPVSELVRTTSRLAFEVVHLDGVAGKQVPLGPTELDPGTRVATILADGEPAELLEFESFRKRG